MSMSDGREDATTAALSVYDADPADQRGSFRRNWFPTIRFALLCMALWLGLRVVAPSYAIEGESMWPSLHDGGRVIINNTYRFQSASHGDVVVFHPPFNRDKPYIKRIIGLAGDTIDIRGGSVYRNGVILDEPYLHGVQTTCFHAPNCSLTVRRSTSVGPPDMQPYSPTILDVPC